MSIVLDPTTPVVQSDLNNGGGQFIQGFENEPNRLNGTDGDDVIVGGVGDDVLSGLGGRDRLFGREGDDILFGSGEDELFGNSGDDELRTTGDGNKLYGDRDDDLLVSIGNDNQLFTGEGNDVAAVIGDNNTVTGSAGEDIIFSSGSGNTLFGGGSGPDTFIINYSPEFEPATIGDFNPSEDTLIIQSEIGALEGDVSYDLSTGNLSIGGQVVAKIPGLSEAPTINFLTPESGIDPSSNINRSSFDLF